jgi:hypothetical protein
MKFRVLVLLLLFTVGVKADSVIEVYATNIDAGGTDLRWERFVPTSGGPTWPAVLVIDGAGFQAGTAPVYVAQDLANAGYLAFAAEHRLAPPHTTMTNAGPPGDGQQDPPSDGRPPEQTDDVQRAIRAARADPQCNGEVVAIAGSAGADLTSWWGISGTHGDDQFDAWVGLSGPYDLDSSDGLAKSQFRGFVENYINHTTDEGSTFHNAAKAASSYWLTVSGTPPPCLMFSSQDDSVPVSIYNNMVTKMTSAGGTVESHVRTGSRHSFDYWYLDCGAGCSFSSVKECTIDFLNRMLSGWNETGSMATARDQHTATLLRNGQVLVAGGFDDAVYLASAELYDPATRVWTVTGSLAIGRHHHTATLLRNGQVLVAGGQNNNGNLASAELYDPATGVWTATGDLHFWRGRHTATLLRNGQVLVAGGYDRPDYLASAELYDPATRFWTVTGSLAIGRHHHTATLLPNGQVLVAGGQNNNGNLASAELYDPATGVWTATGDLATARDQHTATLLPNGQVLVANGADNGGPLLASAELYDPATRMWTTTGSMSFARKANTATLLSNGRVLVAGGSNPPDYLVSAELYDPATGMWTATQDCVPARREHTATLLPNGQVLVSGGYNFDEGGDLTRAQLYKSAP